MAHPGSWWGLPDFGATEKLSSLLGLQPTSQGGSNLSSLGNKTAQSIANYNTPSTSAVSRDRTLGSTTTANNFSYDPALGNYTPGTPQPSSNTGGGAAVPSAPDLSNPAKQNDWARSQGYDGWSQYQDALNAAQGSSAAEIASLNTEFDRSKALLEGQLGGARESRDLALSGLDTQKQYLLSQIGGQKERALRDRDKNIDSAAQAARNTQANSRNMLRALGILNSTAAGEILSRPLNEFDQTKAEYVQMAQQRTSELDDYLTAKTSELASAYKEIELQYGQLMERIQTDLRFSNRERADAVRAVNAALSERMAEIKQAQINYSNEVNAQKANIAMQLAQFGNYNMPGYDVNQMLSTQFNPGTDSYQGGNAQIYDQRKRLSQPS